MDRQIGKFKNHSQTNGKLIDFIPNGGTTLFQSEIVQTGTTVIHSATQHHRMDIVAHTTMVSTYAKKNNKSSIQSIFVKCKTYIMNCLFY